VAISTRLNIFGGYFYTCKYIWCGHFSQNCFLWSEKFSYKIVCFYAPTIMLLWH